MTIPLDMLTEGQTYLATIYRDGEEAEWETNPYDYEIEEQKVSATDVLQLRMASGGGLAIEIKPVAL